jgi:protein-S-isoprenylcysteine O-methyltransferase Ste14
MYLILNLVTVVLYPLGHAVVLCVLAGRWDLWNVWATAAILIAWLIIQTMAAFRKRLPWLKERVKPGAPGRVRWTAAKASLISNMLQWIIAGLDQRFHWSDILPPAAVVAGLVLFTIAWGLATWSALVNPFFSSEVRLQADLGQQMIREGPYAIVRHPGYATIALSYVVSGLALNSLLSTIPALIYVAVTVRVTVIEDRMLQDELAGYADYAAKVRYRLVPGLW